MSECRPAEGWPEPPSDRENGYRNIYEPEKWYVELSCAECEPGHCIDSIYGPFFTAAGATACGIDETHDCPPFRYRIWRHLNGSET